MIFLMFFNVFASWHPWKTDPKMALSWTHLGRRFGCILRAFWLVLGASWATLGVSWAAFGPLGPSWAGLGVVLGMSCGDPGPSWVVLRSFFVLR